MLSSLQVRRSSHLGLLTETNSALPGRGALTGSYQEVSCSKWSGVDGNPLWNGACLAGEKAAFWPSSACGNKGMCTIAAAPQAKRLKIIRIPQVLRLKMEIRVYGHMLWQHSFSICLLSFLFFVGCIRDT